MVPKFFFSSLTRGGFKVQMVLIHSRPARESFPKWPFYRGTRAGRKVKENRLYRHRFIEVITPGAANHSMYFTKSSRGPRCLTNCPITVTPRDKPSGSSSLFVPSLLLSNVMSLAPKIDEIREVVHNANLDLVCITESWLKDHIDNNSVAISGYNVIRRDRIGGICLYVKESIRFKILDDMADENFQVSWTQLRHSRLPRGITCIIVGLVYHSPNAADGPIFDYLYNCLSIIEARFPGCGTILLGDFNKTFSEEISSTQQWF